MSKTHSATRLILLRHGETSRPDLFHGSESDVGLSARGLAQAEAASKRIAAEHPAAIYSSALLRARLTAEPFARACGLEVELEPDLRERAMGALSGAARVDAQPLYDAAIEHWRRGDIDHTHPGGESYRAIRDRALPALARIAAKYDGRTVAIVAHGVLIRVVATALALPLDDFDRVAIDHLRAHDLRRESVGWSYASWPAYSPHDLTSLPS